MSDTCTRCQKAIFAAEQPIRVPGGVYHDACFKCKACNSKLTLKTATTKEGAVWCKSHIPGETPDQGLDMKTENQINAPKQHLGARTIAEKAGGQGSAYGAGAVAVESALHAPLPPTTVNQVNKMETRHNGVEKFTGAQ